MNKKIIIAVLVVLLIAVIGWGWSLQQGKAELESQITTLSGENEALQNKIEKGLVYAKALDSLLEPAREQAGLPTRQQFSDVDWLLAFTEATKATTDSELQTDLNDIKVGGDAASRATILYMDRVVSTIVDVLK